MYTQYRVQPRDYWADVGGKRACNYYSGSIKPCYFTMHIHCSTTIMIRLDILGFCPQWSEWRLLRMGHYCNQRLKAFWCSISNILSLHVHLLDALAFSSGQDYRCELNIARSKSHPLLSTVVARWALGVIQHTVYVEILPGENFVLVNDYIIGYGDHYHIGENSAIQR